MMTIRIANQGVQDQIRCNSKLRPSCPIRLDKDTFHDVPDIRQRVSGLPKRSPAIVPMNDSFQQLIAVNQFPTLARKGFRHRSRRSPKNCEFNFRMQNSEMSRYFCCNFFRPVLSSVDLRKFEEPVNFGFRVAIPELLLAPHLLNSNPPIR